MFTFNCYTKFADKVITIGNKRYIVEEQLNEVINPQLAQCHALTLAHDIETSNPIMIKIRYEQAPRLPSLLNPSPIYIHDPSNHKNITDEDFLDEIKGICYLSLLGHGPRYITHVTVSAGAESPYPEGRVCVPVTDRIPGRGGRNVGEIQRGLSDGQVVSIRVQLGKLGQMNIVLYNQDLNYLRYDVTNDKLCFTGISYMCCGHPKDTSTKRTGKLWTVFNNWQNGLVKQTEPCEFDGIQRWAMGQDRKAGVMKLEEQGLFCY